MTQGNFEVMKANQEVSSERHEASIKNLENQIGQLARQVSSLQTQSGFYGNTTDLRNESCNSINLRSREVSSQEVVENLKKNESKNGVVEKMRDGVVEDRKENKEEEKNKEEKAYEGEVEKRVESESSAKKGKKPLVKGPKFQVPSPYARMPYPRMKKVNNQDLEFCGVVSECFKVEVLEEVYVFLGGDSRKPVIISDLLTPLEENDLLKEAEKVNDDLGWDLDGVVTIYCLHKMPKEEEPDPVVNPQKSSTSTFKASVKKGSKKSPSRSSKKERTNLKTKGEDLKSDSGSVKSLPIDINIAPLNEENKRSRFHSNHETNYTYKSLLILYLSVDRQENYLQFPCFGSFNFGACMCNYQIKDCWIQKWKLKSKIQGVGLEETTKVKGLITKIEDLLLLSCFCLQFEKGGRKILCAPNGNDS
ncbi:unnamed protein product [Trifolium pratense]|uniref:Uncharacterized protein n=1 Tax=Trifolium pratense TaxID=57577 RepID=A0ACB0L3Q2_TRIPR|nr:unnamed protein product [Trifolium pratense]